MEFNNILFYIFAVLMIGFAMGVIASKNPIQSAIFLIFAFLNASALWMLLSAEFLSIVLVLVYIGAVMVLFLFVVMLTDIRKNVFQNNSRFLRLFAMFIGCVIAGELSLIIWNACHSSIQFLFSTRVLKSISNTHDIGTLLFTQYILSIEIVGLILFVSIIAAVSLTIRHRKDVKRIDPSCQVKTKAGERLSMKCINAE